MEEFLDARGVNTQRLREEKIDEDCINLMTDEELSIFIPAYGDRIALRKYFSKGKEKPPKKHSLFETLRIKLKSATEDSSSSTEFPPPNPTKKKFAQAEKREKMISMGIMMFNEAEARYHTLRTKNGGGNRNFYIPKLAKKQEIIESALEVFFPNGTSAKFGDPEEYTFDIMDFQYIPLAENVTVQQVSDITKLSNLRFYLAMRIKNPKPIDTKEKKTKQSKQNKTLASKNRQSEFDNPETVGVDIKKTKVDVYELPKLRSRTKVGEEKLDEAGEAQADLFEEDGWLPDLEENPEISYVEQFLQNLEQPQERSITEADQPIHHHIKVHRGLIFKEARDIFKDEKYDLKRDAFTFEIVLPNGESEIAEDGGGVLRDFLVEFWNSFFEECALGRNSKVPILRHDYLENDWKSIASILFFGWHQQNYFPIQLSRAFISCCIYGIDTFSNSSSSLITEYLSYINESECSIIKSALDQDEDYDENDLIDVLSAHDCRKMPNKDNIRQIIGEIAHKELIQQPMYVKECWFNQLNLLGFTLGDSTIDGIYSKLRPTNKKVVNILKFPKMDEVQTITSEFLKKFIRDLPCDVLSKFLRFCTGSDNLTLDHDGNPKDISVIFNTLKGLERRPVGHTCGMVLEMPSEYDSFLDFRSEFNNILKSDVWVMDFV